MPELIPLGALTGAGSSAWSTLPGKPLTIPLDEAEAGVSTTERTITAARLKAAIEALALTDVAWSDVGSKPAVIAAGATQADARTAIGAGTSSLAIGTTSSTAKAGDWKPAAADISDSGTTGRAIVQAANASTVRDLLDVPLVDDVVDVDTFNAFHVTPRIKYTGSAWPARTVPAGYTGEVEWYSATYPALTDADRPAGMLTGDLWTRVKPAA
jgi:hypothetical protein